MYQISKTYSKLNYDEFRCEGLLRLSSTQTFVAYDKSVLNSLFLCQLIQTRQMLSLVSLCTWVNICAFVSIDLFSLYVESSLTWTHVANLIRNDMSFWKSNYSMFVKNLNDLQVKVVEVTGVSLLRRCLVDYCLCCS